MNGSTAIASRSTFRRSRRGYSRTGGWERFGASSIARVCIVLNIADAAGRRTARDKAHFFAIARGSAAECAAILDLLHARGLVTPAVHRHGRGLLIRVVQMLTRLTERQAAREA